ncbi:hypothetical protein [Oleidesulfovibrio sp.]|uniref:hypothetical protein n=1 Tax=Oleidesulfovibrio sp. TaxID=2909707 RepID=UPI003A8C282E
MGKVLQIRVMAYTFDHEDVKRTWPLLYAQVWGDSEPRPEEARGVLDLVRELDDGCRFAPWDKQIKLLLEPGVQKLAGLMQQLEDALGDWDPKLANSLSDRLEEALTELEKELAKA